MKSIFSKTDFPKAPGGTRYKWDTATQTIPIPQDGQYVLVITASCGDQPDADLRAIINHYSLGKYELHERKVSWKGFNTSAAWDGNSLKGAGKPVYIFLELIKDQDLLIEFVADEKPILKKIELFQLEKGETFKLTNLTPKTQSGSNTKGTPLASFITLGTKFKRFNFTTTCKSGKQKNGTDGDNIKVVKNGTILQNEQAPASRKYKNFLICGDQTQGEETTVEIPLEDFDLIENAIELWYDGTPMIDSVEVEIYGKDEVPELKEKYWYDKKIIQHIAILGTKLLFTFTNWKYSKKFLKNSRKKHPKNLTFSSQTELVKMIKESEALTQIEDILRNELKSKRKEGAVRLGKPGPEITFNKGDLFFALHGLHALHYKEIKTENGITTWDVTLLDTYDFKRIESEMNEEMNKFLMLGNNIMDRAELSRVLHNFEIIISLRITITPTPNE